MGSSPTAPTNELAAKEHLDDRRRRGVTRVRRRQEGHRTQAPPPSAQGLVLEARVLSTNIQDRDGIKLLLEASSPDRLPRLSQLWLDAGYTGEDKGAGWVQSVLGWTAEIVRHPKKLAPEEVMRAWLREFNKEGVLIDLDKLLPGEGPRPFVPKRWIVERTFSWLSQNRRMSKDYERLPESSEAFIYVAMSRLMARRLVRS